MTSPTWIKKSDMRADLRSAILNAAGSRTMPVHELLTLAALCLAQIGQYTEGESQSDPDYMLDPNGYVEPPTVDKIYSLLQGVVQCPHGTASVEASWPPHFEPKEDRVINELILAWWDGGDAELRGTWLRPEFSDPMKVGDSITTYNRPGMVLKLVDGLAAGTTWMQFEISNHAAKFNGKRIWVECGTEPQQCWYTAALLHSDGFGVNCAEECCAACTPMGCAPIPELEGLTFWFPGMKEDV